jgi:S-adenosylmethionine synthetase
MLIDYVFDGTSPPYTPSSPTNPLNLYGRTKRDGEEAVLAVTEAKATVLRVPVLCVHQYHDHGAMTYTMHSYGPAPSNGDTAVNTLLDVVTDQSGKNYKMDHYATRYPTNVLDIADFLVRLSCKCQHTHNSYEAEPRFPRVWAALPAASAVPPILHYTAEEPFTKYEMCLVFAKILGLPHAHIIPDAEPYTVSCRSIHPDLLIHSILGGETFLF